MPRVTELYAYVVADSGPDDEGIPAFASAHGPMPMVGADMERADQLRPMAQVMAEQFGKPITLIRSTGIEVVEVIEPKGGPPLPA